LTIVDLNTAVITFLDCLQVSGLNIDRKGMNPEPEISNPHNLSERGLAAGITRYSELSGERNMSINIVDKIDDVVKVKHVLVSVSDKTGLDMLIPRLIEINPEVKIFSTGGTFQKIADILGGRAAGCLTQVSDYTGQPETQGGLVKTLDFKIYLGLLTETYNDSHQADLERTSAVPIDMVVVNLYPFKETISKEGVTVEMARGNIDIGGPCMIRASAKNFLRVAAVVDPQDYEAIIQEMEANAAQISLDLRFRLSQKAFAHTAAYDGAIADFLGAKNASEVRACYE
jgi:phosphoribosylaminoimidazolecarboxamide formyltransferase/IMP cyclohydrolase